MDYKSRLKKCQDLLLGLNCDALLIEDPTNLFYLTGLELSAGYLIIEKNSAQIFVDGRYKEAATRKAPCPVVLSAQNSLIDFLEQPQRGAIKVLGFNSDSLSVKKFEELRKLAGDIVLKALDNPVMKLREIKEPDEIQKLKEAAELGSLGYDYILSLLREGITEKQIAVELEIFWKRKGSKGLAFDSIIGFGANSSMPHYRASTIPLKKGDAIQIDIGVNLDHYHSDMSRVVFYGEPDPKMKEIYTIVKKAQEAALEKALPGMLIGDLDQTARQIIADAGYGPNFSHSLGHGVGLEIHELPILRNREPWSKIPLQEGMVITIEPGIYLSGVGGVRLEDTIVVQKEGPVNLTGRSKELLVVN